MDTVALAHESLIRTWPTLRDWLDESRDFRSWQERLRVRLMEWRDASSDDDLLLRGPEHATAREWALRRTGELAEDEHDFIRLSRLHRRRTIRRGRAAVALVCALAVLAGALSLFSWLLFKGEQEHDRREAMEALVAYADDAQHNNDPVKAGLAALAARRMHDDVEARAAVMRHALPLSALEHEHTVFPDGAVLHAAASADGRLVAILHRDHSRKTRVYIRELMPNGDWEEQSGRRRPKRGRAHLEHPGRDPEPLDVANPPGGEADAAA
jgi:hypothetical protein